MEIDMSKRRLLMGAVAVAGMVMSGPTFAYTYAEALANCQKLVPGYTGQYPHSTNQCIGYPDKNPPYVWLYNSTVGFVIYWQAEVPNRLLTITPQQVIIPSYSGVIGGKVLTKASLGMSLKSGTAGVAGKDIHLTSSRGQIADHFIPGSGIVTTKADGSASISLYTRVQPGVSTVTSTDSDIQTASPSSVSWLPAKYDNEFLITCYTIANETDWPSTTASTDVCGLPEKNSYSNRFLKDVRMQGSGVARDGTILHYNKGQQCYNIESCARTATGACAVPGTTTAVDFSVIPRSGTINVAIIGERRAQDTGGRITGYHIDEYVGAQPALCRKLGLRHSAVTFLSY
jgi:3D (Asp-Asp-Asp) domain-containing protein